MTGEFFKQESARRISLGLNPSAPDPAGVREALRHGCYPDIFDALRRLPYQLQERLLVQGYTEPRVNMPNGEKLAKELARLNNISWFSPTEEVDKDFIYEKTESIQSLLGVKQKPLLIVRPGDVNLANTWAEAKYAAEDVNWLRARDAFKNAAYEIGADYSLINALYGAGDAASGATMRPAFVRGLNSIRGGAKNASEEAGSDASLYAWGIVIEDRLENNPEFSKGNPFSPMVDLYEKGLWPMGRTENNFVVLHPEPSFQ